MKKRKSTRKTKDIQHHNTSHKFSLFFSLFAKHVSDVVGNPFAFILALLFIIVWLMMGPYFHYSDTWQLVVNTATTIITFLIVFLIQHTQNRDTEIINLKIDELIKGHKGARNTIIDLSRLSDEELQELEDAYNKLCRKRSREK